MDSRAVILSYTGYRKVFSLPFCHIQLQTLRYSGVKLPSDLVLLHEHSDHHSMQCTVPMTLATLNEKLTAFCLEHGEQLTKMEFVERYPFM